jgi:hypothetical protein
MSEQESPSTTEQVRISDELKKLGQQLAQAVRSAAESEEMRKLRQELSEGLDEVRVELQEAFDQARESEEVARLRQQAERAVESIQTGEAQREIRQELAYTLQTLNEQLAGWLERLQAEPSGAAETSEPGPEDSA